MYPHAVSCQLRPFGKPRAERGAARECTDRLQVTSAFQQLRRYPAVGATADVASNWATIDLIGVPVDHLDRYNESCPVAGYQVLDPGFGFWGTLS